MVVAPILLAAGAKAFLYRLFAWLAAGFVVRALLGAGFSFAAFYWVTDWVSGYFEKIADAVPSIGPGLDLLALGGFGVAINLGLSALVGGAAIWISVNAMRIVLSASGVAGATARQVRFFE